MDECVGWIVRARRACLESTANLGQSVDNYQRLACVFDGKPLNSDKNNTAVPFAHGRLLAWKIRIASGFAPAFIGEAPRFVRGLT
jgi:hypothetical protein